MVRQYKQLPRLPPLQPLATLGTGLQQMMMTVQLKYLAMNGRLMSIVLAPCTHVQVHLSSVVCLSVRFKPISVFTVFEFVIIFRCSAAGERNAPLFSCTSNVFASSYCFSHINCYNNHIFQFTGSLFILFYITVF